MTIPLGTTLLRERERCNSIIAEGARLKVSGEAIDGAIRSGMSAEAFTKEYDIAAALADEISASAEAAKS